MASKNNNTTEWNRQDRDLLIQLATKLDGVIGDIKDMRDNTLTRLAAVEASKLDRTEANRLQSESMTVHNDHEVRIRFMERYVWGALALVSGGAFVITYFHPFVH